METRDETERTPRCLREGDDGEVSCSEACMGEPPPDPLGGDNRLDHGRDDTSRGVLQLRWTTGSPWLLDCCDEEAGREERSSLTFDLQ